MMFKTLGRYMSRAPAAPKPVLSFNFLTLSSLPAALTFARASNALMLDAAGFYAQVGNDVPRFLTNAVTQGAAGLLIEPQAVAKNLYARPSVGTLAQHFTTVPAQLTLVSDATNPGKNLANGTQVWQLANNTASAITVLFQGTTGNILTHNIQIWARTSVGTGGSVSLSGIGAVAFSNTSWARIVSEGLTPAATTNQLQLTVNANSTVLFTCANLQFAQEGAAARYASHNTTLIDSAGTQATRVGDRLHMASMSPWFNPSQGTIFMQYEDPRLGTLNAQSRRLYQFDSTTTANDRIAFTQLNSTSKRVNLVISDNGVSSLNENHTFAATYGPVVKTAFGYKANDCAFAWQNILQFTDTSVTLPDQITNLSLGYDRTTLASQMNVCLQKFEYYATKLPNPKIQGLTA